MSVPPMPRDRKRVNLQDGLKLDLNRLARQGFVRPGRTTGTKGIRWSHSYWGEIASGVISADMSGTYEGSFRITIVGGSEQRIILVPRPRHFGGRQWYFVCPYENRYVSVLWRPPGARNFACRQYWGRQVAYATQFLDRDNRAHYGQSRIKNRLIANLDPDEWSLPPKPKWMRWKTYNRYVHKFDHYEAILDEGTVELLAKFMGRA
jgi:hypothetical protein